MQKGGPILPHDTWPRVKILPDPEEDLRLLGIPVGRLLWLGPMLVLPLLMAVVLFSAGYVKAIWFGLLSVLTVYVLFGLDLWQPIAWAVQWWRRHQRRGLTIPLADGPRTADGEEEARAEKGAFRVVLSKVRGAVSAPMDVVASAVDPPAIEYGDPGGLWRRWAEAVRRALAGGASVQAITWLEPDWDPARWESERRAVLRLPDGSLQELAAQRWDMHRHLSLAAGRRAVQMVRVLGGAEHAAELARQCSMALAGAGTWTPLDGEAARDAARRWADWPAWSVGHGGGSEEMAAWLGRPATHGELAAAMATVAGPSPVAPAGDTGVEAGRDPVAAGENSLAVGPEDGPDAVDGEDASVPVPATETAGVPEEWASAARPENTAGGGPNSGTGSPGWDEGTPPHSEDAAPSGEPPGGPPLAPAADGVGEEPPAADSGPPDTALLEEALVPHPGAPDQPGSQVPAASPGDTPPRGFVLPLATVALHSLAGLASRADRAGAEVAPASLHPPDRPLIAVWSPAPAGKTLVAVELAAAAARAGVAVALADLDGSGTMAGRLCLPPHTAALAAALNSREGDMPHGVPVWPGVVAFTGGPTPTPAQPTDLRKLERLLASAAPECEWWIVDLPRQGAVVAPVLDAASVIVLVATPDWSHVDACRQAYRQWRREGKTVLAVINRWASHLPGVPHASSDEILQVPPDAVFPSDPAADAATVTGRPAASHSPTLARAADDLALAVGRLLMARPGE